MHDLSVSGLCNVLNELNEVDPLLLHHAVNTLWKANDLHPDIEYISASDSYMTSMIGILNGALRPNGMRIAVNVVGDRLIFIPEKVGTLDVRNSEEA